MSAVNDVVRRLEELILSVLYGPTEMMPRRVPPMAVLDAIKLLLEMAPCDIDAFMEAARKRTKQYPLPYDLLNWFF